MSDKDPVQDLLDLASYSHTVSRLLDDFDYAVLVADYDQMDIAQSIGAVVLDCYSTHVSPHLCAVLIWSVTMHGIAGVAQRQTIH